MLTFLYLYVTYSLYCWEDEPLATTFMFLVFLMGDWFSWIYPLIERLHGLSL